ncbi:MAG: conserved rane protein of unknown function [Patescibacteria group bacterium]|nr:conserved rane protein of unknown function [Patescibacteria group bacterium]
MKKSTIAALVIVILVIVAVVVVAATRSKSSNAEPVTDTSAQTTDTTSASHETINPNASGETASTPSSTPAANTYTMAQVATHKDATSCWTTINGNVYDVTAWINQHPGGPGRILALCGTDGSAAFNGQHGGQARPASELASFKIGVLAK